MGEFLVSKAGLGYPIVYGSQVFNMDLVMATVLELAVAAVVMYQLVLGPEKAVKNRLGSQAKKRYRCGVLAALMPVVFCACGKQKTATVRLSEVTHSVFYAPQYVAQEQAFFTQERLKIELTNGGGADKVMTAVLTGQADIGLAGPEAAIYVYNHGKDDHPVVICNSPSATAPSSSARSRGPSPGSTSAAGPPSAAARAACRR